MKPRIALITLVSLVFAVDTAAQRRALSQEELEETRANKLAKEFLKNADWHLDYDKARDIAKKKNKLILTYFTRTYAP